MASFFEIGEVGFDAAEVRTIRRQEKNVMAVLTGDGFEVFLFVESGVVVNDRRVWAQFLAQHVVRPIIDKIGIGSAGEEHRGKKVLAAPGSNQAFARAAVAGMVAINFMPT